ncbi:GNAT family N-acetyltransferase [bacterium]|nr:GNAT family N-acetyltransferase [candidate division CSSED10-310 bacterium]
MDSIRDMVPADLQQVTGLYADHMYDSFYAQLGSGFIRTLLGGILHDRRQISLVVEVEGGIAGFIMVSRHAERTTVSLLRRRGPALAWRAALACLAVPRRVLLLLETPRYFRAGGSRLDDAEAEMLFIVVDPRCRRRRLAQRLICEVLARYRLHGIRRVKVSIVAGNGAVLRLLARLGFSVCGEFSFYGKTMTLLARNL